MLDRLHLQGPGRCEESGSRLSTHGEPGQGSHGPAPQHPLTTAITPVLRRTRPAPRVTVVSSRCACPVPQRSWLMG
nr:hypothetical protein CFP56_42148 [Quercus suber]